MVGSDHGWSPTSYIKICDSPLEKTNLSLQESPLYTTFDSFCKHFFVKFAIQPLDSIQKNFCQKYLANPDNSLYFSFDILIINLNFYIMETNLFPKWQGKGRVLEIKNDKTFVEVNGHLCELPRFRQTSPRLLPGQTVNIRVISVSGLNCTLEEIPEKEHLYKAYYRRNKGKTVNGIISYSIDELACVRLNENVFVSAILSPEQLAAHPDINIGTPVKCKIIGFDEETNNLQTEVEIVSEKVCAPS